MPTDIKKDLKKFIPIFKKLRDENDHEAMTSAKVQELFVDVLGYDRDTQITLEEPIKGLRADIAIQLDNHIRLIVEVKKAATKNLCKPKYVTEVELNAAHKGVPWALLTSGIEWNLYHRTFDKKALNYEPAFSVDLFSDPIETASEFLALLHRHSLQNELEQWWKERVALSPKSFAKALFTEKVL